MKIGFNVGRLYAKTVSSFCQALKSKKNTEVAVAFEAVTEVMFVLVSYGIHPINGEANCFTQPEIVSVCDIEDEEMETVNDSNK